jgi:glutamine synthetase
MARKQGAKMVDVKFVDTFGTWQHFSVPVAELTEDVFVEGFGFDGSSIRGWKSIEASDMLAMPDPITAFIDPFCTVPTLSVTCTIAETGTREAYNRDPRGIAQRGEKYLQSTGVADTAVFGPEAEFFIFDNVQFDTKSNGTFYEIDSEEAIWNSGRNGVPNLGYKIRHKEGYFPWLPPTRNRTSAPRCALIMEQLGITVERQHHEVATAGQAEIDFRFDTLVKTADTMMLYKYIIKNVAKRHGKTVTFMPEAALRRQRLRDAHASIAVEERQTSLCRQRIRGSFADGPLLHRRHSQTRQGALRDLQSHDQLLQTFGAGIRSASEPRLLGAESLCFNRIPTFSESPKAKRIEYRPPDPAANPYLCYTALLMAGLDGVLNKIEPGEPMDKNLYELPPEEHAKIPQVPSSLGEALDYLEKDHEFLLKGDVFTSDFLEMWVSHKRKEHDALRLRPHPYEFFLYYDV